MTQKVSRKNTRRVVATRFSRAPQPAKTSAKLEDASGRYCKRPSELQGIKAPRWCGRESSVYMRRVAARKNVRDEKTHLKQVRTEKENKKGMEIARTYRIFGFSQFFDIDGHGSLGILLGSHDYTGVREG